MERRDRLSKTRVPQGIDLPLDTNAQTDDDPTDYELNGRNRLLTFSRSAYEPFDVAMPGCQCHLPVAVTPNNNQSMSMIC